MELGPPYMVSEPTLAPSEPILPPSPKPSGTMELGPPYKGKKLEELDMDEKFGITLQKAIPLKAVPMKL
ncbi:hypothetical protein ACS0TY_019992 [Phlomoides rotata]